MSMRKINYENSQVQKRFMLFLSENQGLETVIQNILNLYFDVIFTNIIIYKGTYIIYFNKDDLLIEAHVDSNMNVSYTYKGALESSIEANNRKIIVKREKNTNACIILFSFRNYKYRIYLQNYGDDDEISKIINELLDNNCCMEGMKDILRAIILSINIGNYYLSVQSSDEKDFAEIFKGFLIRYKENNVIIDIDQRQEQFSLLKKIGVYSQI